MGGAAEKAELISGCSITDRLAYVALISDVLRWSMPTWDILRHLGPRPKGSANGNDEDSIRGLDM